jgi:AcrR family transcriptional regulator
VTHRPADTEVPTPSRRRATTERRREDVLRAALDVFSERGFHKASLAEIAARAGMTHAGVLHHFGSKEQLLIAVLAYRDGKEIEGIPARRPPEGAALLPHLVDTVGRNESQPGIVQAFTVLAAESVTEDHPAQAYFRDRMASLRELIADAIAQHTGRDRDDVAVADSAAAITAVMDGLQIQWLLSPDDIGMRRAVHLTIDALIEHLEARRG